MHLRSGSSCFLLCCFIPRFCYLRQKNRFRENIPNATQLKPGLALQVLATGPSHALTGLGHPAPGRSSANLAQKQHASLAGAPADTRNAISAEAGIPVASGAVGPGEMFYGSGKEWDKMKKTEWFIMVSEQK